MTDIVSPPVAAHARPHRAAPAPEQVAQARRQYLDGVPVKTIVADSGIGGHDRLYRALAGEFPDGSGVPPAPIPRRRAGARIGGRPSSRAALVARIWRAAEKQVEDIEERLECAGLALNERESNARTLATLVKTLRELTVIDEAQKPRAKAAQGNEHDERDDAVPRNIDDHRQSLARKLEAFVARTTHRVPGDAE